MQQKPKNRVTAIIPESAGAGVTIDYRKRHVLVHSLFETEIRAIGSFQNSVSLAFFMLAVGLAVGFGTVLLTSYATLSNRMLMVFVGLTLASLLGCAYFGLKALVDWREAKRKINDILQVEAHLDTLAQQNRRSKFRQ